MSGQKAGFEWELQVLMSNGLRKNTNSRRKDWRGVSFIEFMAFCFAFSSADSIDTKSRRSTSIDRSGHYLTA